MGAAGLESSRLVKYGPGPSPAGFPGDPRLPNPDFAARLDATRLARLSVNHLGHTRGNAESAMALVSAYRLHLCGRHYSGLLG